MPTLRRLDRKGASYYCKYCKRRHFLSSKLGQYHNWNIHFAKAHPNNCIRWDFSRR